VSFQEYLAREAEAAERFREEYHPEVDAFAELAGFFERLAGSVMIAERRALIPGELLLVVTNQMFGPGFGGQAWKVDGRDVSGAGCELAEGAGHCSAVVSRRSKGRSRI
jgi:hypothetical protein